MSETQHCAIYKGNRKPETYLYVAERDVFDDVPEALLQALGELELVMELELTEDRKLARADIDSVMQDLQQQGYHLQLPPAHPAI